MSAEHSSESAIPVLYPAPQFVSETTAVDALTREVYDHNKNAVVRLDVRCADGAAFTSSGVLVKDGDQAVVVTNAHAVSGNCSITIANAAGEKLPAIVDKVGDTDDLAVLKADGFKIDAAKGVDIGDPSRLAPGEIVYALSHPRNYGATVISQGAFHRIGSYGDVSDKSTAQVFTQLAQNFYQGDAGQMAAARKLVASPRVDAQVETMHGSSGGLLVDKNNKLMGIIEAQENDRPGESFSVSADRVSALLQQPSRFAFQYKRESVANLEPGATVLKSAALTAVAASPFTPLTRRVAAPLAGLYYGGQALSDLRSLSQGGLIQDKSHYWQNLAADTAGFVGGAMTLVPRLRTAGMVMVGARLAYDAASDFINTRPVFERVLPKDHSGKVLAAPSKNSEPLFWSLYHAAKVD